MALSEEEKQKHLEAIKAENLRQDSELKKFNLEYPFLSFDERVKYWAGSINTLLRWQAESGLDPYKIFTQEWYMFVKLREQNFDIIMNAVFERFLSWEWDESEYLKRITR